VTDKPRRAIYVISDSTGETGAKVVQAALLQFRHEQVSLRVFSNLRDPKALEDTIDRASAEGALVVYTLVRADSRMRVNDRAAQYGVMAVDLMGPLMARIGHWLGETPVSKPGLLHLLDAEYFKRIEALEFTVKNDDGRLPGNFKRAPTWWSSASRARRRHRSPASWRSAATRSPTARSCSMSRPRRSCTTSTRTASSR
jgi:regulator of PEP synthase PpsR (kinase-PPPase family)